MGSVSKTKEKLFGLEQKSYWIALIFLISIIFRLKFLFVNQDMWHDAAFSVMFAKESVWYIIAGNDVHPPIYYLVLKIFMVFSDNELYLRVLSIVAWSLFYWAVYKLGMLKWNYKVTLFVLTMLSFSNTMVYYSLEIRNYMLGMFFVAMQLYYFFKNVRTGKSYRGFWIFTVLMTMTHFFTIFVIPLEVIFMLRKSTPKVWDIFLKQVANIFVYCVGVVFMAYYISSKTESFWFKEIDITSFFSTISYQFVQPETIYFSHLILILGLVFLGIYQSYTIKSYWEMSLFFIPVAIMWILSQFHPMYHHRFFLFYAIGLYALLAKIFTIDFKNKLFEIGKWGCWGLFLLFAALSLRDMNDNIPDDLYQSQKWIKENVPERPLIIAHRTSFSQTPFKYYFRDEPVTNLLRTNLTKRQRFTAGGAVVKDIEVYPADKQFQLEQNRVLYVIDSLSWNGQGDKLYDDGGVIIYENEKTA